MRELLKAMFRGAHLSCPSKHCGKIHVRELDFYEQRKQGLVLVEIARFSLTETLSNCGIGNQTI